MKIAFFEMKEKWEIEYMKKHLKNHRLFFFSGELNKNNAKNFRDFDIISIFIYSNITPDVISELKKTKAIITRSTGFDHVDIKSCDRNKIKVYNVPRYGSNTVAEYAFALVLALARKIIRSNERVRNLDFSLDGLRGMDIKGKTLGIVGLGEIGACVAEIARGFGMNILVSTKIKDPKTAKSLGFRYVNFNYLLKNSDIITFHVPLLPSTKHMLNSGNINLVKKGALLINTSRGEVIETETVIKALNRGIISGAAMDVLEGEELIKDERELLFKQHSHEELKAALEESVLAEHENVIITPHNAFNTQEALQRILDVTIQDVRFAIQNKKENTVKCE
ncbi:MAG: hydroxyacid dehydrogenase [Nanoarchaeota archaeon]|nr:hydroxyacid dehydrogenase [Nanoarchaeota archaeon]